MQYGWIGINLDPVDCFEIKAMQVRVSRVMQNTFPVHPKRISPSLLYNTKQQWTSEMIHADRLFTSCLNLCVDFGPITGLKSCIVLANDPAACRLNRVDINNVCAQYKSKGMQCIKPTSKHLICSCSGSTATEGYISETYCVLLFTLNQFTLTWCQTDIVVPLPIIKCEK